MPRKKRLRHETKRVVTEWVCPKHDCRMQPKETRFGIRHTCPIDSCTVAAWDGSTSTPADDETREARRKAHDAFDPLWKRFNKHDGKRRGKLYGELSAFTGLPPEQCHIGMLTAEQCAKVLEFCKAKLRPEYVMAGGMLCPASTPSDLGELAGRQTVGGG